MKRNLPPIAKRAIFRLFDSLSIPLYMLTASKETGYAFFLIHKNGISTILSVLREKTNRDVDEAYEVYFTSKYQNHFKFCFIRNPWDRLVSCYTNKVERKKLFPACWDKDFDFFVDFVSRQYLPTSDSHIKLQTSQFPVKEVDHIARFENFDYEYKYIIHDMLKIDVELVARNMSAHSHYAEFYNDKTRKIVEQCYKPDIEIGNYKFGD